MRGETMDRVEFMLLWLMLKQKIKEINEDRFIPVFETGYRPGTCEAEAELIESQRKEHIERLIKKRKTLHDRLIEVEKKLKDIWIIEI